MRSQIVLLLSTVLLGLGALVPAATRAQEVPVDELRQVADDSYAFISLGYVSFFVVTDEGVIATDPASQQGSERAEAYAAAIASVTDQPVRYLIYSHHDADHAIGGEVFADTATFVSHRNAIQPLRELGDARTPVPTIGFGDEMTIELGGKTVELHYFGRNHSDSSLVLHYPAQRVAFAVDFIPVAALPYQDLPGAYPEEWIESLARVDEALDFDTLVIGHPPAVGTKANVAEVRGYLEALIASVRAAQEQGLADNSPEMEAAVSADLEGEYGEWANFEGWLPLNIEGLLAAQSAAASPAAGTPEAP